MLPLQNVVAAAGIPVTIRLLRGEDLAGRLRALVTAEQPRPALVLGNPVRLYRPLRELTGDLLADAPCTAYVAGMERPEMKRPSPWRRLLARLRHSGT